MVQFLHEIGEFPWRQAVRVEPGRFIGIYIGAEPVMAGARPQRKRRPPVPHQDDPRALGNVKFQIRRGHHKAYLSATLHEGAGNLKLPMLTSTAPRQMDQTTAPARRVSHGLSLEDLVRWRTFSRASDRPGGTAAHVKRVSEWRTLLGRPPV